MKLNYNMQRLRVKKEKITILWHALYWNLDEMTSFLICLASIHQQ